MASASRDLIGYLVRECALFRGLRRAESEELIERAECRHVARRGLLFAEGAPAKAFYLLYAGRVKLWQTDSRGQPEILRLVSPGQLCGWLGLSRRDGYPATATALSECSALAWDAAALDELFARIPLLSRNAHRVQARRERQDGNYVDVAPLSVPARLALTLLRLMYPAGRRFEDRVFEDVPLPRADLAQLTGTTLAAVRRQLLDWENQGIVQSRREVVSIQDAQRLESIARNDGFAATAAERRA